MVKQSMMLFGLLDHWTKRLQPLYFTYINLILMAKTCVPLCPNWNLSYPTKSSIYMLRMMTPGDIKAVVHVQHLLPDFVTYDRNTITESCVYFGSAVHCGQQQRNMLKVVLQWITLSVTWLLFWVKIPIRKRGNFSKWHLSTLGNRQFSYQYPHSSWEQGGWSSKH